MGTSLAPGYTIRAPQRHEIESVYALIVASEVAEFGDADGYSLAELQDTWSTLVLNLDAWLVEAPDGMVAGFGHISERRHVRMDVEGYVHPEHVGRGIGGRLIDLAEDRARQHIPLAPPHARVMVNNWINARNQHARALLEALGYSPVRSFWRMETALDEPPPAPPWPDGISLRTFIPGQDDDAMYTTMEAAMADHWGHVAIPFETWKTRNMPASMDASLWFIAEIGKTPAGAAMCSISEGIGWVDDLGVLKGWRRRGIGRALLLHAAHTFHHRGLPRMGLNVDTESPTGATRLYERAGMHVTRHHAAYGKELRPGEALADDAE